MCFFFVNCSFLDSLFCEDDGKVQAKIMLRCLRYK